MEDIQSDTQLVRMLLTRLERISADSYWAHRASGVRGALLRTLEELENGRSVPNPEMKRLIEIGFSILEKATLGKFNRIVF